VNIKEPIRNANSEPHPITITAEVLVVGPRIVLKSHPRHSDPWLSLGPNVSTVCRPEISPGNIHGSIKAILGVLYVILLADYKNSSKNESYILRVFHKVGETHRHRINSKPMGQ
jgi:hypothetical protein